MTYSLKTDAECEQIAQNIVAGHIFHSGMISQHEKQHILPMVFMPLAFMDTEAVKSLMEDEIYVIYEYLNKAGPGGVNGYPSFFSMCVLNKTDAERVQTKADEIKRFFESRKVS